MAPGDFDQADYWRTRHDKFAGDPRSVGNMGRSVEENLAGEVKYKAELRQITRVSDLEATVATMTSQISALAAASADHETRIAALETA